MDLQFTCWNFYLACIWQDFQFSFTSSFWCRT